MEKIKNILQKIKNELRENEIDIRDSSNKYCEVIEHSNMNNTQWAWFVFVSQKEVMVAMVTQT